MLPFAPSPCGGLSIDNRFRFQRHLEQLTNRAKTHMGILAHLSGFTWGLETNVLCTTADAFVISSPRCGLSVFGSGACEQLSP